MGNNAKVKNIGQVFTPGEIVKMVLDTAGYCGLGILRKHILDMGSGDGAFLCEIVRRYVREFLLISDDMSMLRKHLETYVHGIEIDPVAYHRSLVRLNDICREHGVYGVKWDILNANALNIDRYDGEMDYVVGNPPYVRIHNLESAYDNVKKFSFASEGMTDLYLVFFEIGLKMLNKTGKLCYITPSSWLISEAGANMREYIRYTKNLAEVIDFKHHQVFAGVTAYTAIALFDNGCPSGLIQCCEYNPRTHGKEDVDELYIDEIEVDGKFYVGEYDAVTKLKSMTSVVVPNYVCVKNGFATGADKILIQNIDFDGLTIPMVKASTGEKYRGYFPYDKNGKPLPKKQIFSNPDVARYLTANKEKLLRGRREWDTEWWLYLRRQPLKDVYTDKYAVGNLVKGIESIKINEAPAGTGVFGGLYIQTKIPFIILKELVLSEDFVEYVSLLKNYKNSGYYAVSSHELTRYLNYRIHTTPKARAYGPIDGQLTFAELSPL